MALIIVILIILLFGFKVINKVEEINVETILNKGFLSNKTVLKGDVFHKGVVKIIEGELSYFVYIRLEDGKEFTIDNRKLYSKLNICEVININKEIYTYKSQVLTVYSMSLEGFENFRLYEELNSLH